ncbi:MAG: hypothetical protein ABI321_23745 [Polyangia bacterium]
MKRVVLTCLLLASVAHADDSSGTQRNPIELRPIELKLPNRPLRRKVGLGLVIASVALLAHGFLFLGLAKHANDGVLANDQYHPSEERHRRSFEFAQTAFFIGALVTFVPGMVLIWDR